MNSYRNISIRENTRRIEVLQEFHNDVISYFDSSTEATEARQARQRINLKVDQVCRIIVKADIATTMTWTAPPAVGGRKQQLDILLNLFNLDRYRIPVDYAVDLIERAIGVYQSDRTAAWVSTFNPFWWLFRGLLWSVRIPFIFLGAMGYEAARMERSALGKFFKVLVAASALLTILNLLGWLPAAKALLGIE